jgi:hypothetical protein
MLLLLFWTDATNGYFRIFGEIDDGFPFPVSLVSMKKKRSWIRSLVALTRSCKRTRYGFLVTKVE